MAARLTVSMAILLALIAVATAALAQPSADIHAAERERLGLGQLRRGASGSPSDPHAANTREAQVGAYTVPPLFAAGRQQTRTGWPARREQLARLVEEHWVGRIPQVVTEFGVQWVKRAQDPHTEHWIGQVIGPRGAMGPSVDAIITFPAPGSDPKPAPALIDYTYIWPDGREPDFGGPPPPAAPAYWAARGWVHVAYRPQVLQEDTADYMAYGLIGLARWPRERHDWGALRAWAWGASQLRAELARDPRIAGERISLAGHSRFGKGVLVAAAFDHAFADALVSSSGAGGAKLMRRDFGERWENMAGIGAFHWFTPNIMTYAAGETRVHDLPVDAHMLIALRAPRPLFITSGLAERGDSWVDPVGMWTATMLAQPAWELHGASVPRTGISAGMPVAQSLEQARYPLGWYQHGEGHVMWPAWDAFHAHANRYASTSTPAGSVAER